MNNPGDSVEITVRIAGEVISIQREPLGVNMAWAWALIPIPFTTSDGKRALFDGYDFTPKVRLLSEGDDGT